MRKDKYKVTNWSSYNNGLKNRGSIKLWMRKELIDQWKWEGKSKRGGQYCYRVKGIWVGRMESP